MQALEDLADAICKGSARPEDRYYISLPTPLAHSNHEHFASYMNIGSTSALEPALSDQICKMLNRGLTTIDQIQSKLFEYIQSSLASSEVVCFNHVTIKYSLWESLDSWIESYKYTNPS